MLKRAHPSNLQCTMLHWAVIPGVITRGIIDDLTKTDYLRLGHEDAKNRKLGPGLGEVCTP